MVCLDKGGLLKAKTVASQDTFLNPQSCISHFALGAVSFSNPFSLVAEEATSPISSALYTSMNDLLIPSPYLLLLHLSPKPLF
ncbi:hypothetical protein D5086_019695 [Populus alba]|uniref:Uncharacterized protein n=1 Tax=Populus alba TaxID=43335 RepID=A0ACC4BIL4_POPAL